MTDEEILAFAQVLADPDEGFIELTLLLTDEKGQRLEEPTLKLYERLAEVSRRPILYQVVMAKVNDPERHRQRIRWLEDCARRGLRMYGQGVTNQGGFELTFEDWNLFDDAPTWPEVTLGTVAERKEKMQNPELRRRLREEWDAGIRPQQSSGSVGGLVVGEVANPAFESYQGISIGDIAVKEGKHVIDALLDLVVADNLQTEFFLAEGRHNPQYTAEVVQSPHVIPGISDGGAHVKFLTGGCYPTEMLTWLVRDEQLVSLEEAHYKLSYLPAFFGGFQNRGFLREGSLADIVVYDLENLTLLPSEVAHDLPGGEWRRVRRVEGYRWILVNGQVTFEDGKPTGAMPGKLLYHGRG